VGEALASVGPLLKDRSGRCARELAAELRPADSASALQEFTFRLPAETVASLLGAPRERLATIVSWTRSLVRGFSALGDAADRAAAAQAAERLMDFFVERLAAGDGGDGLLARLAREASRQAVDDKEVIVANGIGLLSQAYEATAGLIGNTLVALSRQAGLQR